MRKTFNIKDIEIEDDKSVSEEELLTGDVLKGLSSRSTIEPNTEIEKDEYVQFPDGTTQKAVGKSHERGGIKVNIPDGTEVLSDHLKLTAPQARRLEKEFGINVSTKNTYAEAVEKYAAKVGLKKLNLEQEEVFKSLKSEMQRENIDSKTAKINLEYLSKKINDIENRKKPLEKERQGFFDLVFEMQESTKPKNETSDGMKNGGTHNPQLKMVCEKYGISIEEGKKLLNMARGGTVEEGDEPKFTYSYGNNAFKNEQRVDQHAAGEAGFGAVKETQKALQQLYNNFPDIVEETFGDYIEVDKAGNVKFKGGINLGKEQAIVYKLQEKTNDRMNESAKIILNDPNSPQEEKDKAKAWLDSETFTGKQDKTKPLEQRVRAYDSKLGQFTAGRQAIGVDLVTPEDKKKLSEMGITTVKRITPEILETLSDESKSRIKAFQPRLTENADFFINEVQKPKDATEVTPEEKPADGNTVVDGTPIQDLVKVGAQFPKGPRMFYTPDQSVLPPSPMEAHLKGDIRLERIDPVKIGIENNIQETAKQRNFIASQLQGLPEAQRASVLANLLASGNEAVNQAATNANITNAQNQSQAELFNIGQSGQEQVYGLNNALNFEQRQLMARAKTEEELRNYYDFNRKVNLNNFQNNQKMNLLGSLYPDYSLDFFGSSINFDPSSPWSVQDNRQKQDMFNYLYGSAKEEEE